MIDFSAPKHAATITKVCIQGFTRSQLNADMFNWNRAANIIGTLSRVTRKLVDGKRTYWVETLACLGGAVVDSIPCRSIAAVKKALAA